MSQDGNPKTLEQLKKQLHTKTEEYLQETFNWGSVEKLIKDVLERRIDDIVAGALGFRKDSFDRGWELQRYDETRGVHKLLHDLARQHAEQVLPALVEGASAIVTKMATAKRARASIAEHYRDCFNRELTERAEAWAAEQATTDVEAVFARGKETFLKEIALKMPLRMHDHLGEVAGDDE
jgi:hypothetical protein